MKIYLDKVGKLDYIKRCRENGYGICYPANDWAYPKKGISWFLDNGAFHCWKNKKTFNGKAFRNALWKIEKCCSRPDFIVAPDIVGGGDDSLFFSLKWLKEIPASLPVYLAVQDDMDLFKIEKYIQLFDGIFVGGTPKWKWKRVELWIEYAWMCGLPCHIGCVGTKKHIKQCIEANASSIDTSSITQTNNRKGHGRQYDGFTMLKSIYNQTTLCGI